MEAILGLLRQTASPGCGQCRGGHTDNKPSSPCARRHARPFPRSASSSPPAMPKLQVRKVRDPELPDSFPPSPAPGGLGSSATASTCPPYSPALTVVSKLPLLKTDLNPRPLPFPVCGSWLPALPGRAYHSPKAALFLSHASSPPEGGLEEEGKDAGDFWPQGGWFWEEGVWGPWCHILPLSEARGLKESMAEHGAVVWESPASCQQSGLQGHSLQKESSSLPLHALFTTRPLSLKSKLFSRAFRALHILGQTS